MVYAENLNYDNVLKNCMPTSHSKKFVSFLRWMSTFKLNFNNN